MFQDLDKPLVPSTPEYKEQEGDTMSLPEKGPDSPLVLTPPPMKAAPWTCKSCGHDNGAEARACVSCGGALPSIKEFKAQRIFLTVDQMIRLSWEVEGAESLTLLPGDEWLPDKGTFEISAEVGDIYVLIAANAYGEKRIMTRARALPPQIKAFKAVDTRIQLGYPVIFQWQVEHAHELHISGVGEVSGQSYAEAELRKPGTYTLTARNESSEISRSIELTLPKPEILDFYAGSYTIQLDIPITLYWEAHNYEKLILMPYGLDVTDKTSHDVYPDRSTDYYLVAENASGKVHQKVSLELPPPRITYFGAEDGVSTEGSPVELTWIVENAYRVAMNQGVGEVPINGSINVAPEKAYTDYEIIAVGHSGVERARFRVTRFPIPLEEQLLTLEAPEPFEFDFPALLPPKKQMMAMALRKDEKTEEEKIAEQSEFQIWRAQQMMLTDEMMRMEKASIRKEVQKIISRFKKKRGQNKG